MLDIPSAIPAAIPRVALVTGGAKRLGRAMALALAGAGFDIALHHGHSRAEAEATAEEIRAMSPSGSLPGGRRAVTLAADLSREAETARLLPAATEALGPIGVLVNNASTFERDEWHDATRESWDHHLEPNLRAPFVLAQAFARALPEGAEGVVVNMLDERVWSLTPHFTSYTVSKAGLWALTQSLALALAPRIRVAGIGPGPALPSPRQSEEQFRAQCESTPLHRGTSPEEVARALLAILSLPSFTGQMLALDGGQHLQWSPARGAAQPE
ncbi:SDR family oxidoreductase [Roseomonas gilardii]|uniref:SDR family oxidoreductase n=1 Tax=Roseomonas gilardii TaxID=257708 RepID=A0ABU3MGR9_9PROT|nr:SDR family oxidoreductase [Roseomonas gilardii]MDT8331835.1 SDR family oxidoreductase [Roseomonas gilardii]